MRRTITTEDTKEHRGKQNPHFSQNLGEVGHPLSEYYLSMPQRSQHKLLLMRSCRCACCRACGWFVEGAADCVAGED
jgi:hypothetical protein